MSIKLAISALTIVILSATTHAQVIVPPSLEPGDMYRLVFVTSTEGTSSSTDLATYDAIVQDAAAANPALDGISWRVIGSTDEVDAIDHTGTSPTAETQVPIFRLDGENVANDYADLWDDTINSPIGIDEFGDSLTVEVWTGTAPNGTGNDNAFGLGTSSIPGPRYGFSGITDFGWIVDGVNNFIFDRHYYGISNVLTVPGSTTALKGDADLNGAVDFADIPAFIDVLLSDNFQAESDCDCSTVVDFADIPAFIAILLSQ